MVIPARRETSLSQVLLPTAVAGFLSLTGTEGVAREAYQMKHPAVSPASGPSGSAGLSSGMVPGFTPDFWRSQVARRVPAGTVLTGILQDDISSRKGQSGQVFSILLQEGYSRAGQIIIPPGAKILGAVVSAQSARSGRYGQPGRVKVSLQALVLPDGRNLPFFGFIDRNLNLDFAKEPQVRSAGQSLADYPKSVASFLGSFTSGIGLVLARRMSGLDFTMKKDEVLPVRLNRSLDVPPSGQARAPLEKLLQTTVPVETTSEQIDAGSAVPGLVEDANDVFNRSIDPLPQTDTLEEPF